MDWVTLAWGVEAAGIIWLVNHVLERKREQKQASASSDTNEIDELYED